MPESAAEDAPARTLRRHGLKPRKSLGQNFLHDRSVLTRILQAGSIGAADDVLEIGAGTGVLTRALLGAAGRVVAVELDDSLFRLLSEDLAGAQNLRLWHGNALDFDPCAHFSGTYKLVGNIPYYVTGPILRHFLETICRPAVLVLMVQREVAERMAASPGNLSLLGVSVQFYARPEIVTRVPAGAFVPRPKVDSAIVRLTPHTVRPADITAADFFVVVRAGFSAPRKQLANALSKGLAVPRECAHDLLSQAGIDDTRRAETVSIEEWQRLARFWRDRALEGR